MLGDWEGFRVLVEQLLLELDKTSLLPGDPLELFCRLGIAVCHCEGSSRCTLATIENKFTSRHIASQSINQSKSKYGIRNDLA